MKGFIAVVVGFALFAFAMPAKAGSPHFVGECRIVSQVDTCLTVAGKEAGLGDEDQIVVTLSADVQCVNPGQNAPEAENKDALVVSFDIPVQNGKANYIVTGCVDIQPPCSPPMSLVFSNIVVTDETNSLECMP